MSLDYSLIAYNVRCMRMAHNLTQSELATLAAVDKATVHRVEAGKRAHLRTLEKIGVALREPVSFLNSVLPYGRPEGVRELFVHRHEELTWFAIGDRRRHVPTDSQSRIQSQEERLRLGQLGLVPWFQAYTFAMPNGPGMSCSEIYAPVDFGPNETYEDCIAFCVRGELLFTVREETRLLSPGDGIGYRAEEPASTRPATPVLPGDLPPLLWFITANRKGHVPIEFSRPKRMRTRHARKSN